jgi:hypothetical protein
MRGMRTITYGDLLPLGHERSKDNTTVRLRLPSIERDGLAGVASERDLDIDLAERGTPDGRGCHRPLRPARLGAGAAERIATAFVGNAMPNQWSHAPGTVPPAFTETAGRARRIHEMLDSVPRTALFKRIEDEAIRLGRSNADDHY